MPTRRSFLTHSLTASACGLFFAAPASETAGAMQNRSVLDRVALDRDLLALMKRRLSLELGDAGLADIEASYLVDVGFDWAAPSQPAAMIQTIVAYSFGNRLTSAAGGSKPELPEPGPVNEALAETVADLHRRSHARIFAQWEIAHVLTARHQLPVTSIEPVVAKDGSLVYLSTDGVAEAVAGIAAGGGAGNASALGLVGVVAHRDHAKRCVLTSRARGMKACVASELALPVLYDPLSG